MGRTIKDEGVLRAFAARLNELCDEHQPPLPRRGRDSALGKIFGAGQRGAYKWLHAQAMPTKDKCVKIAEHFGCSYDWLMTGRPPKKLTVESERPHDWYERILLNIFRGLPLNMKLELTEHATKLSNRYKEWEAQEKNWVTAGRPASVTSGPKKKNGD